MFCVVLCVYIVGAHISVCVCVCVWVCGCVCVGVARDMVWHKSINNHETGLGVCVYCIK